MLGGERAEEKESGEEIKKGQLLLMRNKGDMIYDKLHGRHIK